MAGKRSSGQPVKKAKKALDALLLLRLLAAGAGWDEISEQMKIPRTNAKQLLDWAVAETLAEAHLPRLRNIELERLREMHRSIWPQAVEGNSEAIGITLRLMERRAKMCGLDEPAKHQHSGEIGVRATVTIFIPDNGRDQAAEGTAGEVS